MGFHPFKTGNKKQGNQQYRTLFYLIRSLICCRRSVVNSFFLHGGLSEGDADHNEYFLDH